MSMPAPSSGASATPQAARRRSRRGRVAALCVLAAHALGLLSSVQALLSARTSQGAIAWIVSLNTFPYLAVPAWWVFGRSKFEGYVLGRQAEDSALGAALAAKIERVAPFEVELASERGGIEALERLADLPFLGGNRVELLIDGERSFASIFAGIEAARDYVLVLSYMIKSDGVGERLGELLAEKARTGVRVHVVYDEFGSRDLDRAYVRNLSDAGVHIRPFHSTRGSGNRFQLTFRNHRKIVVVDGERGWVGGLNFGEEYRSSHRRLGLWRDTHLSIEGPAVLGLQLAFLEDWHWASDEVLELDWEPQAVEGHHVPVLVLASGPADRFETASLMVQEAIHSAHRRIWIASPYFVPDEGVQGALKLAAFRGVDVRVLIPDRTNDLLVHHAQYAFLGGMLEAGVKVFRYTAGFLHQKVFLVDGDVAAVGTVNLDNRSLRLNFEVTALVVEPGFAAEVERMLAADFAGSRRMLLAELEQKSLWSRVASRAAYLTAPIL